MCSWWISRPVNLSVSRYRASDWQFDTGRDNTYLNTPASLDKNLTNSVDAVYFGDTDGNLFHFSTLGPQAYGSYGEPLNRSRA